MIDKVDNADITSYSDIQNVWNTKRPNDKVNVTFKRDGKLLSVPVSLSKNESFTTDFKGLELGNIDASDKKKFGVSYGVKIEDVSNERLAQYADELKGGVILSVGNVKATDVETVSKILSDLPDDQTVQLDMITVSGQRLRILI